jgi:hypothetical protein
VTIASQLNRLIEAGVADLADVRPTELVKHAKNFSEDPRAIIAVHPKLVPTPQLATLLRHNGKPGFVVVDMTDLDQFVPITGIELPDRPLYLVHDVDRGDDMRNWSPNEALASIVERQRTPLTINEGISWLLQEPNMLEPNHCFMTVGSRKIRGANLDSRTPAVWISAGTGRDGAANRGAPKVGWCWADNRHTWLGFAHARTRSS